MRRVALAIPSSVLRRHSMPAAAWSRSTFPILAAPMASASPLATAQRRHLSLFTGGKGATGNPAVEAFNSTAEQEAAAFAQASALSSSATPGSAASSAAGDAPMTYFDYMDRFWNRKWFGTVDEADLAGGAVTPGSGAMGTADPDALGWFADAFLAVQSTFGMEAWAVLLLFGGFTRLVTLAFSFYGERATARMQLALPELKGPQEAFNKVYYNDLSSALDVQLSATALKSERRRVFGKYDTSNLKCSASFASSPFVVYGLYQVSRLCENPALDVGTSSFFWCTALTLPDPIFVLPIVFCALTLINFELSISTAMKKGWMSNIIWGARLGCLCVVPVAATFRAGVCLYFIGMSLVGLLQPTLLRVPAFRRALKFPETQEQTDAQKKLKDADELQARMTVQFPYLSHLLNPEMEDDNEELFKSATPQAGRTGGGSARAVAAAGRPINPEGKRYAAGTNPLMRETPLSKQQKNGSSDTASAAPRNKATVAGKGSSFASGGWKSAHVAFSEEDFVPSSFDASGSGSSAHGRRK